MGRRGACRLKAVTLDLKMKYDSKIFTSQFPIAKEFVFHLIYHRLLNKAYSKLGLKSEFWTYTINSHLLQAAIKWCMIFGSDGCNQTHLKKLNPVEAKNIEKSFVIGIEKSLGIDAHQWKAYWKEMTDFRNKYAAHNDIEYNQPVPDFAKALNIVFFYDRWIRKLISPDSLAEGSLKLIAENLSKKAEQPLMNIVTDTAEHLNGI